MLIDANWLLAWLLIMIFPALMAFAASTDLFTMTISNRVSLALVAGFLLLAIASGMSINDIGWHACAGFAVLAVTFCFFAFGWIGGGDAKFAASTALWFGFGHLLDYLVYASLFGGALTLVILRFRAMPLPQALARQPWVQRLHRSGGGVPYGIALAAAALFVYRETSFMQAMAS